MESAKKHLERVVTESSDPTVRATAAANRQALADYEADVRARGKKTRRSAWDVLAGYGAPIKGVTPFVEACERRGITPPTNAVKANVRPDNHRKTVEKLVGTVDSTDENQLST